MKILKNESKSEKNMKMLENNFKHATLMIAYIFVKIKDISNSLDFCYAWTSACCRPDLGQRLRMRGRLYIKCKPHMKRVEKSDICRANCAFHTRCGHETSYVDRLMCARYGRCLLSRYNVNIPMHTG